jgi:lipopolysaccharide heptosyltransferase II
MRALAVRLPNWLGDTVMAVPAVRALRETFPEARVLLAGPWARLLSNQGLAETLVEYPRAWSARFGAADVVRGFGADTAVLLPNSVESALAAWYWGAPRRVGFATAGRALLLTDAPPLPEPRQHQVDEYLALAQACGARVAERTPSLLPPAPDGAERAEVRALLAEAGLRRAEGRRLVAVHLGAAYGPAKLWPQPRVVEFCRHMRAEGVDVALVGAPVDAPTAAAVSAATGAASLVGRDRPALLAALLSEVDALVSGDTGVAHLAAALGTPAVALFGPTDPARSAPRGAARILTHPVPCAPCFLRACPIEHPCLDGLAAPVVAAAVRQMLEGAEVAR